MKPKAQEHPAFIRFWEETWMKHRRRNDGRGDARRMFNKHVKEHGADPDDIADGAAYYVRGFLKDVKDGKESMKYFPMAATWINRCAYEDDSKSEREYQRKILEAQARREAQEDARQAAPRPQPKPEPIKSDKPKVHKPEVQAMLDGLLGKVRA